MSGGDMTPCPSARTPGARVLLHRQSDFGLNRAKSVSPSGATLATALSKVALSVAETGACITHRHTVISPIDFAIRFMGDPSSGVSIGATNARRREEDETQKGDPPRPGPDRVYHTARRSVTTERKDGAAGDCLGRAG